jgi:predicted nuclease with TOPRIM domain
MIRVGMKKKFPAIDEFERLERRAWEILTEIEANAKESTQLIGEARAKMARLDVAQRDLNKLRAQLRRLERSLPELPKSRNWLLDGG